MSNEGMRQYLWNSLSFINGYLTGELLELKEPAITAGLYGPAQTSVPPRPRYQAPLITKTTPVQMSKRSEPVPLMQVETKRRPSNASESSYSSREKVVYSVKNYQISTLKKWSPKKVKVKFKFCLEKL